MTARTAHAPGPESSGTTPAAPVIHGAGGAAEVSYPSKHNRLWEPVNASASTGPGGRPQRWKTTSNGITDSWSSIGQLTRIGDDGTWAADNLDAASDLPSLSPMNARPRRTKENPQPRPGIIVPRALRGETGRGMALALWGW